MNAKIGAVRRTTAPPLNLQVDSYALAQQIRGLTTVPETSGPNHQVAGLRHRTGSGSSAPSGSSAAGPPTRRPFPPDHQERILAAVMASITRKKNLNPKRRHRSYARVVKRARHNSYRVKRSGDHGTRHPGPATIRLVNLRQLALAA